MLSRRNDIGHLPDTQTQGRYTLRPSKSLRVGEWVGGGHVSLHFSDSLSPNSYFPNLDLTLEDVGLELGLRLVNR